MPGRKGESTTSGQRDVFVLGLRAFLRPVARFCLRRSLKLQEVVEVLKAVFLEVGLEELERTDVAASTSRLAIMTGVHRKDVDRLRSGAPKKRSTADLLTRVVGQWQNDRRYCTKAGQPRVLPFDSMESEFVKLVCSVSRELNPYTVLFELERVGLVERRGTSIVLRGDEYVPHQDLAQGFQMLADDTDDLFRAVEANFSSKRSEPNLHLTTRYDNICVEHIPRIHEWFMKEGEQLHRKARNFLSQHDLDINPKLANKTGGARVVLGSFSLTETTPESPEEDE